MTAGVLSHGHGEYGARRRHEKVDARLTGWPANKDARACRPTPAWPRPNSS
ncbi:hypothetical protein [Streptomyces sp. RB17]|uniref:hypothetical protein n=1 Tax=Streptomyces sp. RB17 TaxID=2585197 RepID=UPI0012949EE0|nr:hypothetical protein [Streptomyces sp. RB17]